MDVKAKRPLCRGSVHQLLLLLFIISISHCPLSCLASNIATTDDVNLNANDDDGAPPTTPSINNEGDDEYIDLISMSDEELEAICIYRGFELVREIDATTGEPLEYTHQDYVDAASECLQIEQDLEEILTKHPEILDDVRKESEDMMKERDRLQWQLDQMQNKESNGTNAEAGDTQQQTDTDHQTGEDLSNASILGDEHATTNDENASATNDTSDNTVTMHKPIYDVNEIVVEVIQQIKSDVLKVVDFVAPEHVRQQIRPALQTFVSVAKDMSMSVYGLVKRYVKAFLDTNEGSVGGDSNDGDPTSSDGYTSKR
eukprot:scaffold13330_cov205-Alexandrium_tamarense.AAC.10